MVSVALRNCALKPCMLNFARSAFFCSWANFFACSNRASSFSRSLYMSPARLARPAPSLSSSSAWNACRDSSCLLVSKWACLQSRWWRWRWIRVKRRRTCARRCVRVRARSCINMNSKATKMDDYSKCTIGGAPTRAGPYFLGLVYSDCWH